jgi:hypothetical protein
MRSACQRARWEVGAAARIVHNAPKTGLSAPCEFRNSRARPSLRCAPFKYSWCMGRIWCVAIYRVFGAEEMDCGLSEISNVEIRF